MALRDPVGNKVTRIEGWCIGAVPVRSLLLRTGPAEFDVLPYGFERPDVRDHFAAYPNAAKSGFRFSGELHCPAGLRAELRLQVQEDNDGRPEWHAVDVSLDTSEIQRLELNASTRLSRNVEDEADAIVAPDNLEARFRRTLQAKRGLTLRLDIINKCNLRCVMCHFSDDAIFKRPTRQFTGEQFQNLFDSIGPQVSTIALSCGDEPLTSKFLPEILRYLATQHPHVAIEFCTNAMLMRGPIRELLLETGVARLLLSVDAVTKPLLETIRVGCRYEQVIGNVVALRDLKARSRTSFPAFTFNYVMMTRNIHEAPAFVPMAKTMGAESIDFRHMVPIAPYFVPEDVLAQQPARYNFYREKIIAAAAEAGIAYCLPAALPTSDAWHPQDEPEVSFTDFERVLADAATENGSVAIEPALLSSQATVSHGSVGEDFGGTFCNRPFSEIMVRDQDEVLPCPWHDKTLGRLSDGRTLSEIFLGEEFARLRRNMLKPNGDPNCARCPIKTAHLPTTSNG